MMYRLDQFGRAIPPTHDLQHRRIIGAMLADDRIDGDALDDWQLAEINLEPFRVIVIDRVHRVDDRGL